MDESKVCEMLTMLLGAIHAEWPQDKSRPGLVISDLGRGPDRFYASIVRYREEYAGGKYVVVSVKAPTLLEALTRISTMFVGVEEAKPKLREFLVRYRAFL